MAIITVEAEYDGRVLVPTQPLNLPAGLRVWLTVATTKASDWLSRFETALQQFQAHPVQRSLTDEKLRREVIYDDHHESDSA
jgi:predicted DNA-binding antitoxin AbrB/MazE fold protein